jgi:nitrate reductase NapE component
VPGQQETLRAAIKRSEEKSERATFLIAKVVRMKIRKKKKKV